MAEERTERRLAAIMSADVAGYSRLMGKDEAGTLAALIVLAKGIHHALRLAGRVDDWLLLAKHCRFHQYGLEGRPVSGRSN